MFVVLEELTLALDAKQVCSWHKIFGIQLDRIAELLGDLHKSLRLALHHDDVGYFPAVQIFKHLGITVAPVENDAFDRNAAMGDVIQDFLHLPAVDQSAVIGVKVYRKTRIGYCIGKAYNRCAGAAGLCGAILSNGDTLAAAVIIGSIDAEPYRFNVFLFALLDPVLLEQ